MFSCETDISFSPWTEEESRTIRRYVEKGIFKLIDDKENDLKPVGLEYVHEAEKAKELQCPICYEPVWRPLMLQCGHVFCRDCFKDAVSGQFVSAVNDCCPYCRTRISENGKFDILSPPFQYLQVDRMSVKCPNTGCGKFHERYMLANHIIRYCEFTEFSCEAKDCSHPVLRKHFDKRIRCVHEKRICARALCQAVFEKWQEDEHDEECAALTTTCLSCNDVFSRKEFIAHRDACVQMQQCQATKFGCNFNGGAHEVVIHESTCPIVPLGRVIEAQQSLLGSYSEALHDANVVNIRQQHANLREEQETLLTRLVALEEKIWRVEQQVGELNRGHMEVDTSLKQEIPNLHVHVLNMEMSQKLTNQLVDGTLSRLATETTAQWEALESIRRSATNSLLPSARHHPIPFGPRMMQQRQSEHNLNGDITIPDADASAEHKTGGGSRPDSDEQRPSALGQPSDLVNALLMPQPSNQVLPRISSMTNRRSSSPQTTFSSETPTIDRRQFPRRRSSAERSTKL